LKKLTFKQVPMACFSGAVEKKYHVHKFGKPQSTNYTLSTQATHSVLLN